ncbi:MAG: peptide chain release factor N(5)-glutamine methyltransferase [Hyphomicrobiales bacterium]|nr:peptide chain release factor N(5)-glutamine methyltransferase [Hyphomicrobiales bacterium]MCP5370689.1 peptide chain release factor N(5)-glutamine methyltransferase [Hyphomicrobiales bacterium]
MTDTVESLLREATAELRAAGVEGARLDARLLLERATGLDRARLLAASRDPVDATAADRFRALVAERRARRPLAQVLGRREFWSLDFAVTADTLTPRPDSETLVEAALAFAADRGLAAPRVLDLGTGTGCLLLAVLHDLPAATGLGIDASAGAVAVARGNARALGLDPRARFAVADWNDDAAGWADAGPFDLVLANPPYIRDGDIPGLEPEVAVHEPRRALAGGADGLDAYRALTARLDRWLAPGGAAFLELGAGQDGAVAALAAAAGLSVAAVARDLAGIARCLVLRRSGGDDLIKKTVGNGGEPD